MSLIEGDFDPTVKESLGEDILFPIEQLFYLSVSSFVFTCGKYNYI